LDRSEAGVGTAAPPWATAGGLRRGLPFDWTLLALVCAPVFVYLMLPTLVVVPMALTPRQLLEFPPSGISLRTFHDLLSDAAWTSAVLISLRVAAVVVGLSCLVATTAATALHSARFAGKAIILGILMTPVVAPVIVLALADYQFLVSLHLAGTWVGIALAHSVLATPYVFVTIQASLVGLDPALVRSARSLGAGPMSVFWHVYLPALRPGLLAGAVFAFAVSFDEVVIALFLQGPQATTLPVKMFTDIQYELSPKIAAVASLLVGLAALAFLAQIAIVLRRRSRGSGWAAGANSGGRVFDEA